MRTKEKIISDLLDKKGQTFDEINEFFCEEAMDEWAKERGVDFVDWLIENTEIIKEEKITLYRYDDGYGYGNYILDDIYSVYLDKN